MSFPATLYLHTSHKKLWADEFLRLITLSIEIENDLFLRYRGPKTFYNIPWSNCPQPFGYGKIGKLRIRASPLDVLNMD